MVGIGVFIQGDIMKKLIIDVDILVDKLKYINKEVNVDNIIKEILKVCIIFEHSSEHIRITHEYDYDFIDELHKLYEVHKV